MFSARKHLTAGGIILRKMTIQTVAPDDRTGRLFKIDFQKADVSDFSANTTFLQSSKFELK
jgi:hypothetical protein